MSEPAVPAEIGEALRRQGLEAIGFALLSPPDAQKHGRSSYRVELKGGRRAKARCFESLEAARRNFQLRRGLDESFVPAIGWHGSVLLETWVDGELLARLDHETRVEEAGVLLAGLHVSALASPAPPIDTAAWRDRAKGHLRAIDLAGVLAPREVARLGDALDRYDSGTPPATLTHRDFCAENMLIDTRGRLRVIDNEWLAVEPAGFDLGRTFCRWPMSEAAWARFLGAYRSIAPSESRALEFWKLVAALFGAHIRLRQAPERLAVPLGILHRMAGAPDTGPRAPS
jgi:hypothetical protein